MYKKTKMAYEPDSQLCNPSDYLGLIKEDIAKQSSIAILGRVIPHKNDSLESHIEQAYKIALGGRKIFALKTNEEALLKLQEEYHKFQTTISERFNVCEIDENGEAYAVPLSIPSINFFDFAKQESKLAELYVFHFYRKATVLRDENKNYPLYFFTRGIAIANKAAQK